jgi:hypothetical protein
MISPNSKEAYKTLEAARRRYNSITNLCKGQDVTG